MKRAYDNARFPDAGTPAFIISIEWLNKYKAYCFYDELKYNQSPSPDEDHVTAKHPGQISNTELLHDESKFLKGTGTIPGFEEEVIDTYLLSNVRERINFEFVNEEIWLFLKDKYGCDQSIKRWYAARGTYTSLCEVDARFKLIPVFFVRADDLYRGAYTDETFSLNLVQLSAKKSYTDMKKRLADVLTA